MKIRAKVSFAGAVTMYRGEERECSADVALPLIDCGYAEEVGASTVAEPTKPIEQAQQLIKPQTPKGGKTDESKRNNR